MLIAYGARFEPGDLDITPALDDANLRALSNVAAELGGVPAHVSEWRECPPLTWHSAWTPEPATVANLDHLLVTAAGMLDYVPSLCGLYEDLVDSASPLQVSRHSVLVADLASVLDRIDGGPRQKELVRMKEIEELRRAVERGTQRLTGLDHLISR